VVRLFVNKYPDYKIVNLDKLTYAGNLANLKDVEDKPNYEFVKGDIVDEKFILKLFEKNQFDGVIHLAAESHVDRSISNPTEFVYTNVIGTVNLLNAARHIWKGNFLNKKFYHISTDEVYGSLGKDGKFTESTPLAPNSSYSASKASADHMVMAYVNTFGMNASITRCSNNYGPYQFPEKLIPLMISNALEDKSLPVYGDGMNVRDWLHVDDHCRAIEMVYFHGHKGEAYNIGGNYEKANIEIVRLILEKLGKPESLITYVTDRPGHDRRYAIDASKIHNELGWQPEIDFEAGISQTIEWYINNKDWCDRIRTGEYLEYYSKQYGNR
ncbi:MAG: dTDP-glucose 4,6-dehydratase, partial [Bacteroidota bacterium]